MLRRESQQGLHFQKEPVSVPSKGFGTIPHNCAGSLPPKNIFGELARFPGGPNLRELLPRGVELRKRMLNFTANPLIRIVSGAKIQKGFNFSKLIIIVLV